MDLPPLRILLLLLLPLSASAAPEPIATLKPLLLETSLGSPGRPSALIVAGDTHAALAGDLQSRIHEATGIKLPVFDDRKALRNLDKKKHLILIQMK